MTVNVAAAVAPPTAAPITWDELQSRCTAAARLALKSDAYGWQDIEEVAADLLLKVWETVPQSAATTWTVPLRSSLRGPAPTYSQKLAQKSKDDVVTLHERAAVAAVAAPTFTHLYNWACNLRRSLDRQRARDLTEGANRAAEDAFTAELVAAEEGDRAAGALTERTEFVPVDGKPNRYRIGTSYGVRLADTGTAHRAARDLLSDLGVNRLGRAYPLAYCAARSGALFSMDLGAAEMTAQLADELKTTPRALTMQLTRARRALPSVKADRDRRDHAAALGMVDAGGIARKPTNSRTHSADLDPRDRRPEEAPVRTVVSEEMLTIRLGEYLGAVVALTACAPLGVKVTTPDRRPAWARSLKGATAARLAHAAKLRDRRAALRSAEGETATA